jgi:hypothetical protein
MQQDQCHRQQRRAQRMHRVHNASMDRRGMEMAAGSACGHKRLSLEIDVMNEPQ